MLGDDLPGGFGVGLESLSEVMKRGGKGQGTGEVVGGGLVKALMSGLLKGSGPKVALESIGDKKGLLRTLKSIGAKKDLSSTLGIGGGALKMLGGMLGETKGPKIGVGDAGEYAGTLANLVNPENMAKQGIQEGTMDLYNTLQSGGDWLATGNTAKFKEQGESQLKGDSGSITRGWSMIANVIGSVVTGDSSEMDRIGKMADKGELGALPKLGSKLGDKLADLFGL